MILAFRGGSSCFLLFLILASGFAGFTGCDSKQKASDEPPVSPWVTRGRAVYQANCIACHNSDPHKPGALGPDVFGSSKELLEARILHGEYPAGYKPKRTTQIMQPLPQVKNEIDSLHAYLNQPGK